MDDQLVRNNTTYISTSLAADVTNYSQDYVGQLAREGYVESVKVGHKRFVGRDDVVSYALERKSDLSVSDITDNHIPDDYQDSAASSQTDQPEDDESEPAETETADEREAESEAGQPEAIVLPDEHAEDGRLHAPSDNERASVSENRMNADSFALADRANTRWQKSRDGFRPHAEASNAEEKTSATPMILALLLAVVVSFGAWVGPLSSADKSLGRMAYNVKTASQSAYHALGYGLDTQIRNHGPLGTVSNSLQETYSLAVNSFTSSQQASKSDGDSTQVAAAGSTANTFISGLRSLGQSIVGRDGWLTRSPRPSQSSFADYYQQPDRLVSAETIISQPDQTAQANENDTELRNEATDQPDRGAVVVSAPTSSQARAETEQQIRKQFSDPVSVTASSSNSGIIQPRFDERLGDQYMYVMVPTDKGTSTATTTRE